jgi:hypothetical protein
MQYVDQAVLDKFKKLFSGRTDWYGHRDFSTNKCWTEGLRDANNKLMKDENDNNIPPLPLSDEHFHRHFNKVQGLGIIPILPNGNVKFGCLDIDNDDIDHVDLVTRIKNLGLPLHVFVTRSKAAHAIFFIGGEGMPAALVQKRLYQWSLALGCGKDLKEAEVFPKQKDLENPGSVGNYINIPFFQQFAEGIEPDDHRGKFVTSDGKFVGLEEFVAIAEQHNPKMSMPLPIRTVAFSDGPPCLETLQQKGIPEGMRNLGLYNVGVYFKKSNPDEWEDLLQAYNNKFMVPPFHNSKMPKKEMMTLIKSIRKKDYQYKCNEDPIASVCEKGLCKTRAYGIKTKEELLRAKVDGLDVPIKALKRYETDPVTWGLVLTDDKVIKVSGSELQQFTILSRYIMDAMTELPPLLKPDEWRLKLSDLLKNSESVEVSEDSGNNAMILSVVETMVVNGLANPRMLESMSVYLEYDAAKDGSMAYFKTKSLREHLLGQKIPFELTDLTILLTEHGWVSKSKRIEGEVKRVWRKWHPGLVPRFSDDNNIGDTVDEALSRTVASSVLDQEQHDPK